jgi:flagellar hook-associated protein 2
MVTSTSSTSTSTLGPAITSLGVGSGLDAAGIVDKLMTVEQRPVTLLQTAEAGLKTTLSSYGQMQSLLTTFQTKAQALSSVSLWNQTTATSGDSSVVTASTADGAVAGSYAVSVQALASSQTVTSGAFATANSTLGEGSLTIELGTWAGGTPATGFTSKTGASAVTINIGAGETSLSSIRDKINAAGAGVTASIINDANGARLSLRSTTTGAENGFRVTANETVNNGTAGAGLSTLAYDAAAGSSPMSLNQSAGNAKATVNGIAVESASNTVSNVSDGLTLNLLSVSSTPVQIGITASTDAVNTAVKDFVTAFNGLASFIQTQTAYDATSKTGGPLQGDRATISLQWGLRGVINEASTASSVFGNLSDVGISMQKDGTLAINSTKLANGLANLPELRKMFAANTDQNASSGFATRFGNLASTVLGIDGSLATRQQGLQHSIDLNEQHQAEMTTRLDAMRARLTKQYQTLDTTMATLTALSSYVTQQFSTTTKTA